MIKKYFTAFLMLAVFLAAFLPFASNSPDGLETAVSSLGIKPQSVWQGLMNDYSVTVIGNTYASTLLAGTFGIIFVLAATAVLGTAIMKRSQTGTGKS
jgi:hypothetical protein